MRATTFADMLARRLHAASITKAGLARTLSERGHHTSRQAVHQWVLGRTAPAPWRWQLILDVLDVPERERPTWSAALQQFGAPAGLRSS